MLKKVMPGFRDKRGSPRGCEGIVQKSQNALLLQPLKPEKGKEEAKL
jgi:hypothetical protein